MTETVTLSYSVDVHQNVRSENEPSPSETDIANWIADGMRAADMETDYVEVQQQ